MPKKTLSKIWLALLLVLVFLLLPTETILASDYKPYEPEVGIPGSDFEAEEPLPGDGQSTAIIGEYVKAIYTYGVSIVGILAAVVLMMGGLIWLTAGGNSNRVESAKQWIGGALTGLVLVLTSYMLLYQINPELVNFNTTKLEGLENRGASIDFDGDIGCCQFDSGAKMLTRNLCESDEYDGEPGNFMGSGYEKLGDQCVAVPGCCPYNKEGSLWLDCKDEIPKKYCENPGSWEANKSCWPSSIVGDFSCR